MENTELEVLKSVKGSLDLSTLTLEQLEDMSDEELKEVSEAYDNIKQQVEDVGLVLAAYAKIRVKSAAMKVADFVSKTVDPIAKWVVLLLILAKLFNVI
jgi:chromosome segregation and condensation protein ScpB